MTTGLDRVSFELANGAVRVDDAGLMTLTGTDGGELQVEVPGLADSSWAGWWTDARRAFVLPQYGSEVAWASLEGRPQARLLGRLDRLTFDGYDPGGLERVLFEELDDGDVLLVYELGAARLSPAGSMVWHASYDELGTSYEGVHHGLAWFEGEDERFGYELESGKRVSEHLYAAPLVDANVQSILAAIERLPRPEDAADADVVDYVVDVATARLAGRKAALKPEPVEKLIAGLIASGSPLAAYLRQLLGLLDR